jgi:hypothetical protein
MRGQDVEMPNRFEIPPADGRDFNEEGERRIGALLSELRRHTEDRL